MSGLARTLAMLGLAAVAAGGAATTARADDAPVHLQFQRITDTDILSFATRFFYKRYPSVANWSFSTRHRNRENWTTVTRDHGYAAEVDLNGDGAPDLILMIDDPDWCDVDGCLGGIFRKSPKGYELICEAPLSPSGTMIQTQKENGFRLIATETKIIHWAESQQFDSGTLCDAENP